MICDYGRTIRQPRSGHPYRIGFGMGLLSTEDEQICAFSACRDRLHDYFKTSLYGQRERGDSHAFYPESGDPLPCTEELRLLLLIDYAKYSLKDLYIALSSWHMIEEFAGIEKTKAELVKYEKGSDTNRNGLVLLTGNKIYTKFPQLLSALTLFLRFGFFNPQFVIKNFDSAEKDLSAFLDKTKGFVKDGHYMKAVVGLAPFILKNRDYLFEALIETDLFPLGDPIRFHTNAGIVALCNEASITRELNVRVRELKKMIDCKTSTSRLNAGKNIICAA